MTSLLAAGFVGAILASAIWWLLPVPESDPGSFVHFRVTLPEEHVFGGNAYSGPLAFSRDGEHLLFTLAGPDGRQRLYRRSIRETGVHAVPGTLNASVPFFSWDGTTIAFHQDGEFRKVSLTGGAATRICDFPVQLSGVSWGPDDIIVFAAGAFGLMKVSADGGAPETLTMKAENEMRHRWPQFLPGGKTILFTVESETGFRPAIADLATGNHRILEGAGLGRGARFLSSGHIVYAEQGAIYAFRFDPDRLVVEGRPVPVHDGVYTSLVSGLAYFRVSDESLIYLSDSGESYERQLLRVDRSGDSVPLIAEKGYFRNLRFSPDGTKLATVGSSDTPWTSGFTTW